MTNSLMTLQQFFENVGYWRLTSFLKSPNSNQSKMIQKITHAVLSIFVMVSACDVLYYPLSFKAKAIAHGVVLMTLGSLGMSFLLNKVKVFFDSPQQNNPPPNSGNFDTPLEKNQLETHSQESVDHIIKGKSQFSSVKRNLFPLFEEAAHDSPK